MAEYIPSTREWVRDQVELYEGSGGMEGLTLRDTGMPVIIVTNKGNKTGAIRKTPLMRAVDDKNYILVASQGGAPKHPVWANFLPLLSRRIYSINFASFPPTTGLIEIPPWHSIDCWYHCCFRTK